MSYIIDTHIDRMIMAQAELENLPVITYDAAFHTGLIRVIPSTQSQTISKRIL
jgi:PIN domain nuclease of toxin-antitoxin system